MGGSPLGREGDCECYVFLYGNDSWLETFVMRERGSPVCWPELNGWTSVSFSLKFQQPICHGFLIHRTMPLPPSSVWIMTVGRDCGGRLLHLQLRRWLAREGRWFSWDHTTGSLSKLGAEPRPGSLPAGPCLRPSPGSERHTPPLSPASSLPLWIWSGCFFCHQ